MRLMMMMTDIKLQQMCLSSKDLLAHLQQTQAAGAKVRMSPHPSSHMICGASSIRCDGNLQLRFAGLLVLLLRSLVGPVTVWASFEIDK